MSSVAECPVTPKGRDDAEIQQEQQHQLDSNAVCPPEEHHEQNAGPQKGVKFCFQCLLVMAVVGTEMCMSFEQVYQVPILRFLGTPLSMVTINGIICGVVSIIIIPISGYVTDKGSNTMRRRRIAIYIAMMFFLCGLLLLIICGFIKISSMGGLFQNTTSSASNATQSALNITAYQNRRLENTFAGCSGINSTSDLLCETRNETGVSNKTNIDVSAGATALPITVYISICGFALIDVGYDSSLAMIRAYIVDSVPKFQHVRLLILASLVQSLSGLSFCSVGVFNISDGLGNIFNVDGTAALLIFFCTLLIILIIVGFMSTTITGYFLTKSHRCADSIALNQNEMNDKKKRTGQQRESPHSSESSHSSSQPLLLEPDHDKKDYSTLDLSTSFSNYRHAPDKGKHVETNTASEPQACVSSETTLRPRDEKDHANITEKLSGNSSVGTKLTDNADRVCKSKSIEITNADSCENIEKSNDFEESNHTEISQTEARTEMWSVSWMNKRLAVLVSSAFFMDGGLLGFMYYGSNAVTSGIFRGDPLALPGTEGKERYEEGLRMASLGILCMYIVSTIVSVSNKKIIDIIGEERQYILSQCLYIITVLTLTLTHRLELYFVAVVAVGAYRQSLFTLTFVMANKFSQSTGDNSESPDKSGNRGKVMSLIGFLMPAHYILISVVMGPLLEATADVWLPLLYGVGCAVVSLGIFLLLYLVNKTTD